MLDCVSCKDMPFLGHDVLTQDERELGMLSPCPFQNDYILHSKGGFWCLFASDKVKRLLSSHTLDIGHLDQTSSSLKTLPYISLVPVDELIL